MRIPWGRPDDKAAQELDEEIQGHFDMAVADRIARGESREQALANVHREFGNIGQVKELSRESWGAMWLDRLVQDLRYAFRSLRRSPAFTSVAMLTLALGIGANSAMFTVVRGVLLRPLPFPDPGRLYLVSHVSDDAKGIAGLSMTDRDYVAYRHAARAFSSTTTYNVYPASMLGAGEPARVAVANVTPSFFATLGIRPMIGRPFADGDEASAASGAAIISASLWRERFGADRAVIGRSVKIEGFPKTVVGVMPEGITTPAQTQVWLPLEVKVSGKSTRLRPVIARLAPNATLRQAMAELKGFVQEQWPRTPANERERTRAEIKPLSEAIVGNVRHSLLIFSAAVGLVLLIACANVSNLLLMRSATRGHEFAIRSAIGATPSRILRQVVTESVLVSFAGGLLGLGVAWAGVRALLALAPAGLLPRVNDIRVDLMVVSAMLLTCLVAGLIAGIGPAVAVARRNVRDALAEAGRATSRSRLRTLFLTTEAALALVLLIGAGLLVKSFVRLRAVDLGFTPDHVVSTTLEFAERQYPTKEVLLAAQRRMIARIGAIPGVRSPAAVNFPPLGNSFIMGGFTLDDGRPLPDDFMVLKPCVSANYFSAMSIPIREGRAFTDADDERAPGVVIISRSIAQRLWPGASAVGKRISMSDNPTPADWVTIVGVVDDIVQQSLAEPPRAVLYLPLAQAPGRGWIEEMTFVGRFTGDASPVVQSLRAAVHEIDPLQPVTSIMTMDARLSALVAEPRFRSVLLMAVSAMALLLAAIGIYGVVGYAVTERTRELGIRMALGASSGSVMRLVLSGTARVIAPGLIIGVGVAYAATRVLATFLFQVQPRDALVFASASVMLLAVSLVAGYAPARRASRIDPVITIKL